MTAICILTRLRFWLNVILNNVLQSLLCSPNSAILYNAQQYAIMWNKAQQNVTMLSNMRHCSAMCNNAQQCATMLSNTQKYSAICDNAQQCLQCSVVLSMTIRRVLTCLKRIVLLKWPTCRTAIAKLIAVKNSQFPHESTIAKLAIFGLVWMLNKTKT